MIKITASYLEERIAVKKTFLRQAFDTWLIEELKADGYNDFTVIDVSNPKDYTIVFDCPKTQFLYCLQHGSNSLSEYWYQWLDMGQCLFHDFGRTLSESDL